MHVAAQVAASGGRDVQCGHGTRGTLHRGHSQPGLAFVHGGWSLAMGLHAVPSCHQGSWDRQGQQCVCMHVHTLLPVPDFLTPILDFLQNNMITLPITNLESDSFITSLRRIVL